MLQKFMKPMLCTGTAALLLSVGWLVNSSSGAIIFLGDSVPLSSLVNNPQGQVVAGDKKFTGFGYDFTGDMPGAAGVNVRPIMDDLE